MAMHEHSALKDKSQSASVNVEVTLKSDELDKPDSEKLFGCSVCNKRFNLSDELMLHHTQKHDRNAIMFRNSKKSHECSICKRKMETNIGLFHHMRSHTNGKRTCPSCKRTFIAQDYLDAHLKRSRCSIHSKRTIRKDISVDHRGKYTEDKKRPKTYTDTRTGNVDGEHDRLNVDRKGCVSRRRRIRARAAEDGIQQSHKEIFLSNSGIVVVPSKDRLDTMKNVNRNSYEVQVKNTNNRLVQQKASDTEATDVSPNDGLFIISNDCQNSFEIQAGVSMDQLVQQKAPDEEISDASATDGFDSMSDDASVDPDCVSENPLVIAPLVTVKVSLNRHYEPPGYCKKPYDCSLCKQQFGLKRLLRQHMAENHNVVKRGLKGHSRKKLYECQMCPQKFSYKSGLITHVSAHRNAKPFKCSICKKTFITQDYLDTHMHIVMHKDCQTSEKQSSTKNCFVDHMRMPSAENTTSETVTEFVGTDETVVKNEMIGFNEKEYQIGMHETPTNKLMHMIKTEDDQVQDSCVLPCENLVIVNAHSLAISEDTRNAVECKQELPDASEIKKEPFRCFVCDVKFASIHDVLRHLDNEHQNLKTVVKKEPC